MFTFRIRFRVNWSSGKFVDLLRNQDFTHLKFEAHLLKNHILESEIESISSNDKYDSN